MIPIVISVTSRIQYLPYMFNSLLASKLHDAKIFIHANREFIQFYKPTQYSKPMEEELKCLNIPQIHSLIHPFSDFCSVEVTNKDERHVHKVRAILDQYFTRLNTDYIIYLKDDIIFNQNWLQQLLELYDKLRRDNLGFIAGCDLNTGIYQPEYVQTEQNMEYGYIPIKTNHYGRYGSSQCYLITRQLYEKWKTSKLSRRLDFYTAFNQATDFILNQASVALGFQNYLMIPQYIQHIGTHSTQFFNRKMLFTHDFKSPYCYGHFVEMNNDN